MVEQAVAQEATAKPAERRESVERSDAEPVNKKERRSLYQKRVKIYPRLARGSFRKLKWIVMAVTLAIYYVTPWLRWDRGPNAPDPALRLGLHVRGAPLPLSFWPVVGAERTQGTDSRPRHREVPGSMFAPRPARHLFQHRRER